MRNNYFPFAALASAALLFSCSKEIDKPIETPEKTPSGKETFEYVFQISDADAEDNTKTTLDGTTVAWEASDRIGIFAPGNTNTYGSITTLNPVQFPIYLSTALSAGDKVYAYYPHSEANNSKTADAITLTIPASQSGDFDAMPQVALPYETTEDMATGSNNTDKLRFCNLGSVIRFLVYSSTGAFDDETVESIKFTGNTGLAGSVSFDLTAVDYDDPSTLTATGYASLSATTTESPAIGTSTSNAGIANLVIAPGTYFGTVVLLTDKAKYTYTIAEAKKITFNRSAITKLGLDLESATCTRVELHPIDEVFVPATSIAAGDKVLLTSGTSGAIKVMGTQNTNNRSAVNYTITDGIIVSSAATYPLTVGTGETESTYYTLYDPTVDGYLYAASSTNNYLKSEAEISVDSEWEIVLNGESKATTLQATASSNRKVLRFNESNSLFSCYSSGQKDVYVFKKVDGTFVIAADKDIAYTVTSVTIDYNVYNGSGATTVAFKTNPGDCASNLAINEGTKKVTFDITANAGATRTVEVNITNNGVTKTVSINQVAAPSQLVMSTITAVPAQSKIVFSWEAVANAEGYQISTNGGTTYSSTQAATSYTWTGLTAFTEYTIKVKAIGDGIYYLDSDAASKTQKTTLAVPTSITWTKASKTVTWTDTNTGAGTYGTDYKYQYTLDNWETSTDVVAPGNTLTLSIDAAKTIKLKAICIIDATLNSTSSDGTYCNVGEEINYVQAATITEGYYLFAYKAGNKVASSFSSNYIQTTTVTTEGKTSIAQTGTLDTYAIKLEALTGDDAGYYAIKQGTVYIGYKNDGTKFVTDATVKDNYYKWSISVSGDDVTISCKAATSRYWAAYNSSGTYTFRCYSTGSNPKPTLYKRSTDL